MTLLTWSHACAVGVQAMDDQHGILMDTMNELHKALVRGCTREQLEEHLGRLSEFSRLHFVCEEQLLERHGFPGLEAHRNAHQQLMREINETAERVGHTDGVEVPALFNFLRTWYAGHIEGLDQEHGTWLNERGIY